MGGASRLDARLVAIEVQVGAACLLEDRIALLEQRLAYLLAKIDEAFGAAVEQVSGHWDDAPSLGAKDCSITAQVADAKSPVFVLAPTPATQCPSSYGGVGALIIDLDSDGDSEAEPSEAGHAAEEEAGPSIARALFSGDELAPPSAAGFRPSELGNHAVPSGQQAEEVLLASAVGFRLSERGIDAVPALPPVAPVLLSGAHVAAVLKEFASTLLASVPENEEAVVTARVRPTEGEARRDEMVMLRRFAMATFLDHEPSSSPELLRYLDALPYDAFAEVMVGLKHLGLSHEGDFKLLAGDACAAIGAPSDLHLAHG